MPASMKCFKRFFKHTWHPQQMIVVPSPASIWDYPHLDQLTCIMNLVYDAGPDSQREYFPSAKNRISPPHMDGPTRFESAKTGVADYNAGETELGEVKIIVPSSSMAMSTIEASSGIVPCGNGGCKSSSRSRVESRPESPWHMLKTIFLISVIIALVVWVIVYTLLAQYQIL